MPESYPYMNSNNKIEQILAKVRSAAKPPKFSHEFLKQLGFSSSNDRAIIPLLKKMDFISEDGSPTEYYNRLRDNTDWQFVLAERIQDLYKDLYIIDTEIHKKGDEDIKGAITRVTGKDAVSTGRYFATFRALANLARFGSSPKVMQEPEAIKSPDTSNDKKVSPQPVHEQRGISFQHNIEIHLPATTDVTVYNAIFKSLRENLLG